MFTSAALQPGHIYTRDQLRTQFNITDATLNTGIFQPAGSHSIWLFITEHKTSDRTPYEDHLDGDTLYWQGQSAGRKDALIIEHAGRGLEILVFYRTAKYQYAGAGFRYEGRFLYHSHSGAHPTGFILHRDDTLLATATADIAALQSEERYQEGAPSQILVNHYERDPALRAAAIRLHGTSCQVCGFNFAAVYGPHGDGFIEVHHLRSLSGYGTTVSVDPTTDMAVLCANCHRMIHRHSDHPLTLAELKAFRQTAIT